MNKFPIYTDLKLKKENSDLRKAQENFKCQICHFVPETDQQKRYIHVHHIDKTKTNHALWNLLVVCQLCHSKLHKEDKFISRVSSKVLLRAIKKTAFYLRRLRRRYYVYHPHRHFKNGHDFKNEVNELIKKILSI